MKARNLLLTVGLLFSQTYYTQQKNWVDILPTDTPQDIIKKAANVVPHPRQLRWQNLELTAFIHFGINTFTEREWGTGKENPTLFNPTSLDTDQWVKTLKDAGFKQIIFTAKHHDGFCLWNTTTTEFSLKNSPYKNGNGDIVEELAQSCKKHNIGFGIYLSPWDMNAESYGTPEYNDFFIKQLSELLTNYGKIDEVWFDGANGEGKNGLKQEYDFERWYQFIREKQPEAVIAIMGPDVRWVGTETGKGRAEEWSVVPFSNMNQNSIAEDSQKDIVFRPEKDLREEVLGNREKIMNAEKLIWYPAETDVSIQTGWFFNEKHKTKTPEHLTDIYFTSVGMNGVLLLNIPPDKRGLIHERDIKALQEWTKIRENIFKNNLLKGAKISSKSLKKLKNLLDGNNQSSAKVKKNNGGYSITFELNEPKTFNVINLQENITKGQRVEKFSVHYSDGQNWKPLASATTIGYKRLLRTKTVTAKKIRVDIEQSRLEPHLSEIGLFMENKR